MSQATDQEALRQRVESMDWYHTFDLPGGISTKGMFDHRKFVHKLPLPRSLAGMRCLDAAAADGFFGFEMARRGAAEVVSLDLPDPDDQDWSGPPKDDHGLSQYHGRANRCFEIVRDSTSLPVKRVDGSLYEIEGLGLGSFDLVFLGNILLHLQDPIRALQQIRTVTGGELLSVEPVSLPLTVLRPFTPTGQYSLEDENTFWVPNLRGHRRVIVAGGFEIAAAGGPILQPMGRRIARRPDRMHLPRNGHQLVWWLFTRQFGAATSWVRARPSRR